MINQGGCGRKSAGIGNIDYVKDLLTENIVTRNLRCSKFGFGHHPRTGFGWVCFAMLFIDYSGDKSIKSTRVT